MLHEMSEKRERVEATVLHEMSEKRERVGDILGFQGLVTNGWVGSGKGGYLQKINLYTHNPPHLTGWRKSYPNSQKPRKAGAGRVCGLGRVLPTPS